MHHLKTTRYLTAWLLLASSACSSSTESADSAVKTEVEPKPAEKHPGVETALTSYEGELCPPDSVTFSSGNGSFYLDTSTDPSGTQRCEIHIRLTVPAGYMFSRPLVTTSGEAYRLEDSASQTQIGITYALSDQAVTSRHEVTGVTLDASEDERYFLVDTPDLEARACGDEPADLDLEIDFDTMVPDNTAFRIGTVDAEFNQGVQWYKCPSTNQGGGVDVFINERNHLPL